VLQKQHLVPEAGEDRVPAGRDLGTAAVPVFTRAPSAGSRATRRADSFPA
jgi:hypothetical protein